MSKVGLSVLLIVLAVLLSAFFVWLVFDPVRADRNSGIVAIYRTMLRKWLQRLLRLTPKNERRHWYHAETWFTGEGASTQAADDLALDLWQFILGNPDWIRNAQLTAVTVGDDKRVSITCELFARSVWSANDELTELLLSAGLWEDEKWGD